MDEGEHEQADAFDAHDDVFVLFDALHVAFIAFKRAAGDAYALVLLEIRFAEYLAAGRVGGRQQTQQVDGALRYHLDAAVVGVAVNPERH